MTDDDEPKRRTLSREDILAAVERMPEEEKEANRRANAEASANYALPELPALGYVQSAIEATRKIVRPIEEAQRAWESQNESARQLQESLDEQARAKHRAQDERDAHQRELVQLQRAQAQRDKDRDAADLIRQGVETRRWRVTIAVAIFAVLVAIVFGVLAVYEAAH